MRAIWLENQTLSRRDDAPEPTRQMGEALLRIRLAGLCGTDLELVRGYYPFTGIPGHEFVGEVVEADNRVLVGQRVVGEINLACGHCDSCRANRPTHCENRTVLGIRGRNGAFAEYLTLPETNLHPVPDSVPDAAAVFVEPLAAALEIQERVAIHPSSRALVIGAGRLGQLIAQTLALTGCDLRVMAKHPRQRDLLAGRGIACLNDDDEAPARHFDVVVEATGSPAGFQLARQAVRPRGTLVLKSTYRGELGVDFSSLVVDEITLIGSRCGPFPAALRLLEMQAVDPMGLIEAEYPLARAVEAFERAGQRGALKVLVRP
ncbi:MDR/zinc-dependent alcohol dehydrogenase-like family protein [Methylomagnum sp.]